MDTKILVLIATVLWGVWAFCARKAVSYIPPLSSSIVACATSLITVPGYMILARLGNIPVSYNVEGVSWALAGAITSSVGSVALLYALKNGGELNVVALTAAYPAITFLLGIAFLGDKMTVPGIVGLVLVSAGAVLLSR